MTMKEKMMEKSKQVKIAIINYFRIREKVSEKLYNSRSNSHYSTGGRKGIDKQKYIKIEGIDKQKYNNIAKSITSAMYWRDLRN